MKETSGEQLYCSLNMVLVGKILSLFLQGLGYFSAQVCAFLQVIVLRHVLDLDAGIKDFEFHLFHSGGNQLDCRRSIRTIQRLLQSSWQVATPSCSGADQPYEAASRY